MNFENEIKKLANILVTHSINVKKCEMVWITLEGEGMPLAKELSKQISKIGAYSIITISNSSHLKYAPEAALKQKLPHMKALSKIIDARVVIDDESDLYDLQQVTPNRFNLVSIANQKERDLLINKKKWCIVRYPTLAYALQAGISYESYKNYCFKTMNINWEKEHEKMKKLQNKLDKTNIVRIIGKKTDLSFSVKGRKSKCSYGINNMPAGEVFTAPVKETVNGTIFFPVAYYRSKKYENILLTFKEGKVIDVKTKNNKKAFENIISIDKNSRYLGELGIGTNKGIKKIVGDILFDEKKGGTIHLALGSAYEENFKENLEKLSKKDKNKLTNKSALHWDLIMKPTKLLFDNKIIKF